MQNGVQDVNLCKSVFKTAEDMRSKAFTQKWIELINRLEKQKSASAGRQA